MRLRRAPTILYLGFWGGAIGVLGKWALVSFTPIQLIFIRILGTLLILGAVLITKRQFSDSLKKIITNFWHFATLAFWGVGAAMILGFMGLGSTSAIAYDLLFNLSGIMMVAVSCFGYGEKLKSRDLGFLFLALIGTALIIFRSENTESHSIFGDSLVLVASVGWAIYSVVGGKAGEKKAELDPLTNLFGSFVLASIPLAIYIDCVEPINRSQITRGAFVSSLMLAVFGTALLFLLWFRFVKNSTSAASAVVALSENVGGVLFPIIFLGESLTLRVGVGGVIIILALVFMEWRSNPVVGGAR